MKKDYKYHDMTSSSFSNLSLDLKWLNPNSKKNLIIQLASVYARTQQEELNEEVKEEQNRLIEAVGTLWQSERLCALKPNEKLESTDSRFKVLSSVLSLQDRDHGTRRLEAGLKRTFRAEPLEWINEWVKQEQLDKTNPIWIDLLKLAAVHKNTDMIQQWVGEGYIKRTKTVMFTALKHTGWEVTNQIKRPSFHESLEIVQNIRDDLEHGVSSQYFNIKSEDVQWVLDSGMERYDKNGMKKKEKSTAVSKEKQDKVEKDYRIALLNRLYVFRDSPNYPLDRMSPEAVKVIVKECEPVFHEEKKKVLENLKAIRPGEVITTNVADPLSGQLVRKQVYRQQEEYKKYAIRMMMWCMALYRNGMAEKVEGYWNELVKDSETFPPEIQNWMAQDMGVGKDRHWREARLEEGWFQLVGRNLKGLISNYSYRMVISEVKSLEFVDGLLWDMGREDGVQRLEQYVKEKQILSRLKGSEVSEFAIWGEVADKWEIIKKSRRISEGAVDQWCKAQMALAQQESLKATLAISIQEAPPQEAEPVIKARRL